MVMFKLVVEKNYEGLLVLIYLILFLSKLVFNIVGCGLVISFILYFTERKVKNSDDEMIRTINSKLK